MASTISLITDRLTQLAEQVRAAGTQIGTEAAQPADPLSPSGFPESQALARNADAATRGIVDVQAGFGRSLIFNADFISGAVKRFAALDKETPERIRADLNKVMDSIPTLPSGGRPKSTH